MTSITSLRLVDFRSYPFLDAAFARGPVALSGDNGAGKTNLLEAISFLSPGRGLRRAAVDALARVDHGTVQPAWGVTAVLDDDVKISVGQVPEQPRRRQLRIDAKPATGAQLAERVSMLWLTPAQDRLFTGPAGDRRKFIDRLTLAHNPGHGTQASRFEKARAERNRLLSDGISDDSWYRAIEADLARHGAEIATARVHMLDLLQDEISARETAFPQSLIGLDGTLEAHVKDGVSLDELMETYRIELAQSRHIDLRAGRTLVGPHRTELHVTHATKAMPAGLCSTGEQKALLIGLILAQARALRARQPILLLDEVAAHLDAVRRAALAKELLDLGLQVFMTGTDAGLFSDFGDAAQHYHVGDGQLKLI